MSHSDIWHGGLPDSTSIEAHPKIASKPFDGVHRFRLSIRPAGGFGGAVAGQVQVSFQFTCRTGVGVTVLPVHTLLHTHPGPPVADDHVDLLISLNSADYQAPKLPPRQTDTWDKDRLNSIAGGDGDIVTFEQVASIFTISPVSLVVAELALAHGVDTDKYDVPDVNALDRSHAVPFVQIDQIPAGQGIVIDDNQPYPVVGFLEIRKHHPVVVSQ